MGSGIRLGGMLVIGGVVIAIRVECAAPSRPVGPMVFDGFAEGGTRIAYRH